ncbi:MAG: DEAD/DEAH box helicase [Gammaproteobacteria bacterium]|tara:strand:- start:25053 stop:26474 length:1422 start_codon:yes stop_codon:yes gene_type:complete
MNYKFKSKPFAHQLKALEMSWDKEVFAYFMEMGTGKSKVLIDNIAMLYDKGKINGALIIAPKGVYKNWFTAEIPNHLPDHIEKKIGFWKTKPDAPDMIELLKPDEDLHICIMNVEAFSTKKGLMYAYQFLNSHRTMIAIDESTTIKNPSAKRTKAILELSKHSKYRRILTGSPVTKSPLDLFTQCYFLDPYLLDQSSYYAFRVRYAKMRSINVSGRQIQIVVGYRNLGELSEKLRPFSYRCLKDDCFDLPKKTYMKRIIELTDEQRKLYKQMKTQALAFLNGKMTTTATVITQMMRLHQITCGHFKADDGSVQEIKSNRLNEFMDIMEEVEGKAVIWAHYRNDIESIYNALEKKFPGQTVTYFGDTSTDDRQKAIEEIQNPESKIRFLLGTPQTGGYGITLTGASTMIYYSNGYDLEKRQQSEARIDRYGQERPMTYIDIMAEDTIDEKIVDALKRKVNIATEIMGEELKEWI